MDTGTAVCVNESAYKCEPLVAHNGINMLNISPLKDTLLRELNMKLQPGRKIFACHISDKNIQSVAQSQDPTLR